MSIQSKHTPGPWLVYGTIITDQETGTEIIGRVNIDNKKFCANARLIAAAPKMLGALEIVNRCHADNEGGVTLGSYEMDIIRAAIAEARGE